MEVGALYATNRARTKECLHLKTVATMFKSGVIRFPNGFLWGAATAAHQIEGNNVNNDWWQSEEAGLLPHRSGDACDSWTRWADDIALLRQIGCGFLAPRLNARMTVAGSAIFGAENLFAQSGVYAWRCGFDFGKFFLKALALFRIEGK